MRAKRVGADTFECPLIFACQIIDMRVGLRLKHSLRDNPARPMGQVQAARPVWIAQERPKSALLQAFLSTPSNHPDARPAQPQ
jgi:hypothetical protein